MYHTHRKVDSPISLEELVRDANHGRSVWMQNGEEGKSLFFFDAKERRVVTPEEFACLQRKRAETRRLNYPGGRRKPSRRFSATLSFVN